METNTRENDLASFTWRKASYSGGEGGNCLEVAQGHPTLVPVRDSKNPGPVIAFGATAWGAFVAHLG
ncbi:DUF397 domain-containing protein [Streptomyces aureus]|uniref:DUF397 domain-containing protein n=1 Tax=Streptomyces aureus TaxID=193461 RepID=UPI0005621890|nr:DUF397 domain-containing protein [Streptomyces aureus]